MENWVTLLGYLLAPVTAVASYFAGLRKSKNDFLQEMQKSINLLTAENTKLIERVVALNTEVIALRKENGMLRNEVEELNRKLENVKTITRKI
jgi:threonine synthase